MLFNKKHDGHINAEILGEHFSSILTTAEEIRDFKHKKIFPTPTHEVHKPVNINDAWPSARDIFVPMFAVLNDVAERFKLKEGYFESDATFPEALDAFIETVNTIMFGIADALGTGQFSQPELREIDALILSIQSSINKLRKHVMEEFQYPIHSVRPPASDQTS